MLFVWAIMSFGMYQEWEKHKEEIDQYKQEIKELRELRMTVTAYTDKGYTATCEKPVSGLTCAVSPDMKRLLGRKIYVQGIGVRVVNDLTSARFTNRIDLHVSKDVDAIEWGKKELEIVVL